MTARQKIKDEQPCANLSGDAQPSNNGLNRPNAMPQTAHYAALVRR